MVVARETPPTTRPASYKVAVDPEYPSEDERRRVLMNQALAGLLLVLVSPLMLGIAVLIKLTSRGPILYTQPRIGIDRRRLGSDEPERRRVRDLGGVPFRIYKFRTMTVDAEKESGAVWASQDDPRVTVLGGILRKTRLDELPQLFNVLLGEMNIVGPRPERPSIFADLREKVPDYGLRQRTKPGITGWAQINQQYDTCLDDVRRKVEFDLEYIKRRSVAEDLRIMLKTIPVVLFRRGGW